MPSTHSDAWPRQARTESIEAIALMLLSDRLWRTHEVSRMVQRTALVHWRQHALAIRCYAACNAGMLVGMLLAEGGIIIT